MLNAFNSTIGKHHTTLLTRAVSNLSDISQTLTLWIRIAQYNEVKNLSLLQNITMHIVMMKHLFKFRYSVLCASLLLNCLSLNIWSKKCDTQYIYLTDSKTEE